MPAIHPIIIPSLESMTMAKELKDNADLEVYIIYVAFLATLSTQTITSPSTSKPERDRLPSWRCLIQEDNQPDAFYTCKLNSNHKKYSSTHQKRNVIFLFLLLKV